MGFGSADSQVLYPLLQTARKRLVYAAPSLDMTVANALVDAVERLGADQVSVILDPDPEVFRLGYGSFDAVMHLQHALETYGAILCHEPGLRIGVVIADDRVAVFAPIPELVAETRSRKIKNGIGFSLSSPPESIARDLGVGPAGRADQKIGLEGIPQTLLKRVQADLDANPPVKFDVARQLRVFNSYFEFVEWEVKGCKLTSKKVTIPPELVGLIEDPADRRRLQTQYALVEGNSAITEAQGRLDELRRDIESRFVRTMAGYGQVVLRREREPFDAALRHYDGEVEAFSKLVEAELKTSIENSVKSLAKPLAAALERNPPSRYRSRRGWDSSQTLVDYVEEELKKAFRPAEYHAQIMKSRVIFKGVTYESLQDEAFLKLAKKVFPEMESLFEEFLAVEGPELSETGRS